MISVVTGVIKLVLVHMLLGCMVYLAAWVGIMHVSTWIGLATSGDR